MAPMACSSYSIYLFNLVTSSRLALSWANVAVAGGLPTG